MKRYNLIDWAYCGRRIRLIKRALLSWRAVYREGEWRKSCVLWRGRITPGQWHSQYTSGRLSEVLHVSAQRVLHDRVPEERGISCMKAWLLCICTSSAVTSAETLLTCYESTSLSKLRDLELALIFHACCKKSLISSLLLNGHVFLVDIGQWERRKLGREDDKHHGKDPGTGIKPKTIDPVHKSTT